MDEVSVTVNAPPERVWGLVTDITAMGRWSPSNTGGKWLGGTSGPAPGAKFLGFNRRGPVRWVTRCKVVECEPFRRFAFQVLDNNTQWGFRLDPTEDGGTRLTQWRNRVEPPPAVARFAARLLFRGKLDEEMADGMRGTLAALKAEAERNGR